MGIQEDDKTVVARIEQVIGMELGERAEYDKDGQLIALDLSKLGLTVLPSELGQLSKLQELYLSHNQLTQIPVELGQLSNLQIFYLQFNWLTQIPVELGRLSNLRRLDLNNNRLTQVPVELGRLSNLRRLDLNNNRLTQVPVELGRLFNLQALDLLYNPLLTPPPEILIQGTQAILAFLRELQQESVQRYETKLILVGEGGTGKSSLLLSLQGEQFNPMLNTTHGIEVDTLALPHPSNADLTLSLNTWDFGGQHIYHATHQFFLTRRSLYLVVWNARLGAEQGRLHYWLDTIKALAPDCPVLLVATHTDERAPDLNYQLYKDAYPQIVGTVNVSNKYGTGVETFKALLAKHTATLPLVGQSWPTSWVDAEKTLLSREEHHVNSEIYRDICVSQHIEARLAQGTFGGYLHDLGKILYFRDDYELCNLVVLKPNWITKAISLVLEDDRVRDARGILAHAELPRIWSVDEMGKPYEPHLYPLFLRLMEKFDLSYQIGTDIPDQKATHSLVPQLLPYEPPSDLPDWPERSLQGQTHLQMIYRCDFVPAGIMSWFIVRTHRYTSGKHWRDGVILAYREHFARVELNAVLREIRLVVWGIQPHNFFTILKDTLDLILSRFQGLRIRREVPCICHWETKMTKPCQEVYRYEEDLIRRMEADRLTIECPASFLDVSVPELLYGIHTSTISHVRAVMEVGQHELRRQMPEEKFRIGLRENGEHSFLRSIETLKIYMQNRDNLLLKDAIMFLHHGIELLMKQVLVQHSSYLIFEDLKELARKQKKADEDDVGIFTLDDPPRSATYDVAIERVKVFVKPDELDESLYKNLRKLSNFRNRLEHHEIEVDRREVEELLLAIHDPVLKLFEAQIGKLKQLRTPEANADWHKLSIQLSQLSEWNVRHFTRQWNLEMRKMDAECPSTFILSKNRTSQAYKLHLLCQYPSGPHCLDEEDGYDLDELKEWWVEVSPWLEHIITFLKYGVPLAGAGGAVVDAVDFKNFEAEIGLLEKMVVSDPRSFEYTTHAHGEREETLIGPALRALYSFLKEQDKAQFWGGLQKVITPDGNILWLCEKHARPYESPVLQI